MAVETTAFAAQRLAETETDRSPDRWVVRGIALLKILVESLELVEPPESTAPVSQKSWESIRLRV